MTGRTEMAGQLTALGIGKLRTPGKYYDGAHGLFLQPIFNIFRGDSRKYGVICAVFLT